ncbi:MAG: hypothetical protein COA47_09955 [Robiginitomaculum sp.]|nr:MAG: hypothetical protein COA47_09955 [Robiginitomaculum sp.]
MSNELGPIFERLGELGGTLKAVDSNLTELKEDHADMRAKLTDVEKHVSSLNSVEKKLGHLGINYSEANDFRDLIGWVTKKRDAEKNRNQIIFKTVLTAGVLGLCATFGGYFYNGLKADINANSQAVHQPPVNGNPRGIVSKQ